MSEGMNMYDCMLEQCHFMYALSVCLYPHSRALIHKLYMQAPTDPYMRFFEHVNFVMCSESDWCQDRSKNPSCWLCSTVC